MVFVGAVNVCAQEPHHWPLLTTAPKQTEGPCWRSCQTGSRNEPPMQKGTCGPHQRTFPWKQMVINLVPNVPIDNPLAAISCELLPRYDRAKFAGVEGSSESQEPFPRLGILDKKQLRSFTSTHSCYSAPALVFPVLERAWWNAAKPETLATIDHCPP